MALPSVLIAGCGDIGSRLAGQLLADRWRVAGLRRDASRLPAGVLAVQGDLLAASAPAAWPAEPFDYVVYCVSASRHDEQGYREAYVQGLAHLLDWLKESLVLPKRLLFVSSSSVYGQQNGEWIDEQSVTQPAGFSGRLMLEAERLALESDIPATVVRLTGIYGPGRERFIEQVRQGYSAVVEPPQYGNRIHSDDAAGLLKAVLSADRSGQVPARCYIGVDDDPAPLEEVVAWLRERLCVTEWRAHAQVRRTGSKRCRNALARQLGWAPRYPSFREGYAALLGEQRSL